MGIVTEMQDEKVLEMFFKKNVNILNTTEL